jgi:hypothetical protein
MNSMCPVVTRTQITKPDGSVIVSALPVWVAERTYREADGYRLAGVWGVESMHGFRILSPMAKSLYCAANHC